MGFFFFLNRSPTVALAICQGPARAAVDSLKLALSPAPFSFNRFVLVKKPGAILKYTKPQKIFSQFHSAFTYTDTHTKKRVEIKNSDRLKNKTQDNPSKRERPGLKPKATIYFIVANDNLSAILNAKHD